MAEKISYKFGGKNIFSRAEKHFHAEKRNPKRAVRRVLDQQKNRRDD